MLPAEADRSALQEERRPQGAVLTAPAPTVAVGVPAAVPSGVTSVASPAGGAGLIKTAQPSHERHKQTTKTSLTVEAKNRCPDLPQYITWNVF